MLFVEVMQYVHRSLLM